MVCNACFSILKFCLEVVKVCLGIYVGGFPYFVACCNYKLSFCKRDVRSVKIGVPLLYSCLFVCLFVCSLLASMAGWLVGWMLFCERAPILSVYAGWFAPLAGCARVAQKTPLKPTHPIFYVRGV